MKYKYLKIFFIVIFTIILIMPSLTWMFFSISKDKTVIEMLDYDLKENRNKNDLTDLNIENITQKLDDYYNDRVPYRSIIISTYRTIDSIIELPYENFLGKLFLNVKNSFSKKNKEISEYELPEGYHLMDEAVSLFYGNTLSPSEIDPYDDSFYPPKLLNNEVLEGRSNWLYLFHINIENFTGKNNIKEDEIKNYVNVYQELTDKANELNKKLLFVVFPEKEEVYPEYMPTLDIIDEKEKVLKVYDYIKDNTNINYIYPKSELLEAKNKYRVYYKYDTHYNKVGAFIGLNAIHKALEQEEITNLDYKITKKKEVIKDLLSMANKNPDNYNDDFDYDVEYKNNIKVEEVFELNTNATVLIQSLCKIYKSNSPNKQKMFYIGDSFRFNLMEMLAKDYEESVFCDYKMIDNKDILDKVKQSDVIIVENVERFEEILMQKNAKAILENLKEIKKTDIDENKEIVKISTNNIMEKTTDMLENDNVDDRNENDKIKNDESDETDKSGNEEKKNEGNNLLVSTASITIDIPHGMNGYEKNVYKNFTSDTSTINWDIYDFVDTELYKNDNIIMIGDSYTGYFTKYINDGIYYFGKAGEPLSTHRESVINATKMNPKLIIFFVGANDFVAQTSIEDFQNLLKEYRDIITNGSNSKIAICSFLDFSTEGIIYTESIKCKDYDNAIKAFTKQYPDVDYIDLRPYADVNETKGDGIHYSKQAYLIFKYVIEDYINNLFFKKNDTVIVGDSRTLGLYYINRKSSETYYAVGGMYFQVFKYLYDNLLKKFLKNKNIIILSGVGDENLLQYIEYLNANIDEITSNGNKVYFSNIIEINEEEMGWAFKYDKNIAIQSANETLSNLDERIKIIDSYTLAHNIIEEKGIDYVIEDGIHFTEDFLNVWRQFLLSKIKEINN